MRGHREQIRARTSPPVFRGCHVPSSSRNFRDFAFDRREPGTCLRGVWLFPFVGCRHWLFDRAGVEHWRTVRLHQPRPAAGGQRLRVCRAVCATSGGFFSTTSHRNRTCEAPGKRCRYVSHADRVARPADSSRKRPRHAEYCHDNTSMPSPPDTPCASPQSSCSQQAGHLPGGRLPEIPSFQLPWPLPSPIPPISESTKSIGHNGMKNRRDDL